MRHRFRNSRRWAVLRRSYYGTAFTCALIELSHMGAQLIDSILTGRMLGTEALTAVGISSPISFIIGIVSGVLASGMRSICAEEIGRGNYKRYSEVSSAILLAAIPASVLCTIVLCCFAGPLATLVGARGDAAALFASTKQYILGMGIGAPAVILNEILASIIHFDGGERIVKRSVLIDFVLNAVFDYIAIRMNLGLFGVGLATSLARYISIACLLPHFRKKDRMLHIRMRLSSLREIPAVLSNGKTTVVTRLSNTLRPILVNNYIIMLGGTAAVGALSVVHSVGKLLLALNCGVQGTIPLVAGVAYGEMNGADMRYIGKLVHNTVLALNAIFLALYLLLSRPLAGFFAGAEPQIRDLAAFGICINAAERYLGSLLSCRSRYLGVINKSREGRILQACIGLPAPILGVLLMGTAFGAYGVLAGNAVGYALLCCADYIANVVRTKRLRVGVSRLLRLDASFITGPGNVIELDIRDMADATLVSEQVKLFCKGHGLDARKSYHAALAVEESARLLFEQNGFSPKMRSDIRVVMRGDDLAIRIRDNGRSAYPFGGVGSEGAQEDPFANIGIRILQKTAKDIRYYHTLKVNYTLITV